MFHYKEIGVESNGGLIGQNMFFTLGIQTLWQRETMIEHGHQGGVVVDATFGTKEKKHNTLCLIHNTCMWSNALVYM
jgi:hypothetical protein